MTNDEVDKAKASILSAVKCGACTVEQMRVRPCRTCTEKLDGLKALDKLFDEIAAVRLGADFVIAQNRIMRAQLEQRGLKPADEESKAAAWYSIDEEGRLYEHDSAGEAREAAKSCLELRDDHWPEDGMMRGVQWGMLLPVQTCVQVDYKERPADEATQEEEGWPDKDLAYICNYVLRAGDGS